MELNNIYYYKSISMIKIISRKIECDHERINRYADDVINRFYKIKNIMVYYYNSGSLQIRIQEYNTDLVYIIFNIWENIDMIDNNKLNLEISKFRLVREEQEREEYQ